MDHLNPKITDTSLKSIKYLVIIILLYISGCDFRVPQDWETPKWILPLTIPMLNETLMVVDMIDSESSSIELIGSDYSVTIDTVMIPEYPEVGSISIDESYFIVEQNGEGELPIPNEQISIIIDPSLSPSINETVSISIQDILPDELSSLNCLPNNAFSGLIPKAFFDLEAQ